MVETLHLLYLNTFYTYKGRMWLFAILTAITAFTYNEFMKPILSDIAFVFFAIFLLHFFYWIYRGIKNNFKIKA